MLLPRHMEELGLPFLDIYSVVATCNSKDLSSHCVTMRESAKDKTPILRVTER